MSATNQQSSGVLQTHGREQEELETLRCRVDLKNAANSFYDSWVAQNRGFLFLFKRVQLHTKPSHGAGDKNNCFLWQIYQPHESWGNGSETGSWEIPGLDGLARATHRCVVAPTSGYWMKGCLQNGVPRARFLFGP